MLALKSDQVHWTHLTPSSLCGTAELRSEDGHHVTVPIASLVSSPLIRSIMSGLHPCCAPFVLSCPVDAEVLDLVGDIFTKGEVKVKDDQILHEVHQLLKRMKVSTNLSCIGIDQEPVNVGIAWMTEENLENVIKLEIEIKQESQYHSDYDFDDQEQESSDPGMESVMDSGGPCQSLDEHIAQEDKDCRTIRSRMAPVKFSHESDHTLISDRKRKSRLQMKIKVDREKDKLRKQEMRAQKRKEKDTALKVNRSKGSKQQQVNKKKVAKRQVEKK